MSMSKNNYTYTFYIHYQIIYSKALFPIKCNFIAFYSLVKVDTIFGACIVPVRITVYGKTL